MRPPFRRFLESAGRFPPKPGGAFRGAHALVALGLFFAGAAPSTAEVNGFEVRATTLNSTFSGGTWTDISFTASFSDTPLVFALPTTSGGNPCAVRIIDVTTTGFSAACLEPPSEDGPHIGMDLHFLAIEPGLLELPLSGGGTLLVEAGVVDTTTAQHRCASGCGTPGWDSVTFNSQLTAALGSAPAVLTQIQGTANETNSGNAPSNPYLASAVDTGSITTSGFDVALERSECNGGSITSNERIGWLAIPQGTVCRTLDLSGGSTVNFEALLTGAVVDGWNDGCNPGEGVSFTCPFSTEPVVIASKSSRSEDDGGWLRRCSLTTGEVRFHVDEDECRDGERNHADQAASVVAFGADFATTAATLTSLADVSVEASEDRTRIRWTTVSEVGTLAFRPMQGPRPGALRPLTPDPLPAHPAAPQGSHYRLDLEPDALGPLAHGVDPLWIEELDSRGQRRLYGPFPVQDSAVERGALDDGPGRWGMVPRRPAERPRPGSSASPRDLGLGGGARELKLAIETTGLYGIPLGDLAAELEAPLHQLEKDAREGRLALTTRGAQVAWTYDPGTRDFLFWGRASDDPLVPRAVYQLRRGAQGLRMATRAVVGTAATAAGSFETTTRFEEDLLPAVALPIDPEGDFWMWRGLHSGQPSLATAELTGHLEHPAPGRRDAVLRLELQGASTGPGGHRHRLRVAMNGKSLGTAGVDDFERAMVELPVPPGVLLQGPNVLRVEALTGDGGDPAPSLLFVDGFEILHGRGFETDNDLLLFTAAGPGALRAGGFADDDRLILLGLDHPDRPTWLDGFQTLDEHGRTFAGFFPSPGVRYGLTHRSALLRPLDVGRIGPPLTDDALAAEYLVIAPPELMDGAERLAAHRQSDGLTSRAIPLDAVYDRFSHGQEDPRALRDLFRHALTSTDPPPRFAVLIGVGHFDYADRWGVGSNPVPPLLTRTADGLFASDGALGDLDGDGIPEISIGRLPVENADQLDRWLAKLERYESSAPRVGRPRALLVSDVPDEGGNYPAVTGRLGNILARTAPSIDGKSEGWEAVELPASELGVDAVRRSLLDTWGDGWDLVAWVGHGGLDRWSRAGLLTVGDLPLPARRPPIVVTATCNTQRFELPGFASLGGALVLDPTGGAIAALGPTGTTQLFQSAALARAWTDGLRFAGVGGGGGAGDGERLGEVVLRGMRDAAERSGSVLSPETLRVFTLFGDPATRLSRP